MLRFATFTLLVITLVAPAALAAAPYKLETKVDKTPDRITGTFQVTQTTGSEKGKLVAAPRLTMNDGNMGRMRMEVDGTNHKLEIQLIKAKDAPHVEVVFLVWDAKTIIQAETQRIEMP